MTTGLVSALYNSIALPGQGVKTDHNNSSMVAKSQNKSVNIKISSHLQEAQQQSVEAKAAASRITFSPSIDNNTLINTARSDFPTELDESFNVNFNAKRV